MKTPVTPKSRRTVPYQILGVISVSRAEKLLLDWANLPDPPDNRVLEWISLRHPQVFGFVAKDDEGLKELVRNVRHSLRLAWDAHDPRHRDWHLFTARCEYVRAEVGAELFGKKFARLTIPGVPDETPFEAAMFHLTQITHRMLHCPNPECAAPYFLRKKKGQKFCSPECADPSRRESKRRWHRENRGTGV
jgi:hypothetical protein